MLNNVSVLVLVSESKLNVKPFVSYILHSQRHLLVAHTDTMDTSLSENRKKLTADSKKTGTCLPPDIPHHEVFKYMDIKITCCAIWDSGVSSHWCSRCPNTTNFWTHQNFSHRELKSTEVRICTKSGQLNLGKVIKIVDNSCQIWRLKWTKFNFGWGSAPDAGGAYSTPPDLPTGPTKGMEEDRR